MRTINWIFDQPQGYEPTIAAGEHLATRLQIDCAPALALWPQARFVIVLRRADGVTYPAHGGRADEDGILRYPLTQTDTFAPGPLDVEIQAREDSTLAKSWGAQIQIAQALQAIMPQDDRLPDWVDETLDARDIALSAAALAKDAQREAGALVAAFGQQEDQRVQAEQSRAQAEQAREAAAQQTAQSTQATQAAAVTANAAAQAAQSAAQSAAQAAQTALANGQSALADAQAAVEMALSASQEISASVLDVAAPCQLRTLFGPVLDIPAAPGSTMRVRATQPAQVSHCWAGGAQLLSFEQDQERELVAGGGDTLHATMGSLSVRFSQAAQALLDDLAPRAAAQGPHPLLPGLVGGQALDLRARVHVGHIGEDAQAAPPTPDAPHPLPGCEGLHIIRHGRNLLDLRALDIPGTHNQADVQYTPRGVRVISRVSGTNRAVMVPVPGGEALVGRQMTLRASFASSAGHQPMIAVRWLHEALGVTGATIAAGSADGQAMTFTVGPMPAAARYLALLLYTNVNTSIQPGEWADFQEVMLALGGAAPAWEPYAGRVHALALSEAAYGLPLAPAEIVPGSGDVYDPTDRLDLLDGDWEMQPLAGDFAVADVRPREAGALELALCTHFESLGALPDAPEGEGFCALPDGRARFFVRADRLGAQAGDGEEALRAKLVAWLQALRDEGMAAALVYPLARARLLAVGEAAVHAQAGENGFYMDAPGTLAVAGCQSVEHVRQALQAQLDALWDAVAARG